MSKGYPSMTALLGLLAVAGYQNRDRIAEWLGGHAKDAPRSPVPQVSTGTGSTTPANLERLLGGAGSAGVGGLIAGGLTELVDHSRRAATPRPHDPGSTTGRTVISRLRISSSDRAGDPRGARAADRLEQDRTVGASFSRISLGDRPLFADGRVPALS